MPIRVEVAYATPETQWLIPLDLPDSTSAEAAIAASGLLAICPELDLAALNIGIFGRVCPLSEPLRAGDRVEIYRPLACDPKTARRQRAAKKA
jgi:hypothetical protein